MLDLILMLLNSLLVGFRSRVAMQAEIIALRHQLTVLQRNQSGSLSIAAIVSFGLGSHDCGRVGVLP
jgi:hypothetical protein